MQFSDFHDLASGDFCGTQCQKPAADGSCDDPQFNGLKSFRDPFIFRSSGGVEACSVCERRCL